MKTQYDFAMVVGRFQPYQNAHHKLVTYALEKGNKVIIVLGSSHSSPTVKNPFTAPEREKMIRSCFDEQTQDRLIFAHVRDYPYNENLWIAEVQNIANEILDGSQATMAIVGHFKDGSSYYLNLFPQWKLENFEAHVQNDKILNATDIRELYYELELSGHADFEKQQEIWDRIGALVPAMIFKYLHQNFKSDIYLDLKKEYEYVKKYKADSKFIGMNFAPTFVTTDTLVTALGHVLIVRRGHQPGKGKLALPGGFLAEGLTLKDNALKELKEETAIRVPKQILESNIISSEVFDYPDRSLRGRTITHAFHIELNPNLEDGLPKVKGGDDAEKAFWLPVADMRLKEDEFFEDHYSIVRKFLGF